MPNDSQLSALDALLTETRQALEVVRSGPSAPATDEEDVAVGHGEALDGMVIAEFRAGRLDSLTVDPRLMRLSSEDLTEHVKTAVNAALDDLDSGQQSTAQLVDVESLAGGLQAVQDRSLRQMAQMNTALQDVVALLREPRR